ISALLGHANLFSIFLSSQLPIALALLFARTRLFVRILSMLALLTGCMALILTLSRTGWVTAAAAMGAVMLLSFWHPQLRSQFLVGRLAVIIGGAAVALAFSGKIMQRLFKSDEGAVDVRFEWLEVAWGMIQAKPVMGWGLNTFVFQMGPFTQYGSYDKMYDVYGENLPVVHNVYALITAEQGFVGMFIFLIFIISILIMGFKALSVKNQVMHALALGGICGFGVYLLDWLASFSLRMDHMGRMFFILLGLIAAVNYWRIYNEKNLKVCTRSGLTP
ncbi:MAG TPA: O-antigen ligase family protein, partial [Bacteroidales bacterium]|nr:O-antigen ligase family protein [Bacteroidales bacterium]